MVDVLAELRAAGGDAADATGADAVDGAPARWVAQPADTSATAAVLKVAAAHGLSVVVRGAGTKLTLGVPPEKLDLVLDTSRLDGVVEHAAGDLIVVVGAGHSLTALQSELARAGQRLGIDPARSGTVGGAVATAATGPGRLHHGPVRDLVIGMTLVRPDGVIAHAGGKVVKNVAGYDLGKLLTGSFGTLGVITQVAFRLHPIPDAQRWVSVPLSAAEALGQQVQAIAHSQLVPAAVELDRSLDGGTLSVLIEGTAPGVEGRAGQALALLGPHAAASEESPAWWGSEPANPSGVLVKLTHEIAALPRLLAALDEAAAATGLRAALRGSVLVGTALVGVDGEATPERVAAFLAHLRQRSGSFGGTAVLLDAPARAKDGVDVWGPVGALDLMRSVKHQFDPERRLAPGRFVGGI